MNKKDKIIGCVIQFVAFILVLTGFILVNKYANTSDSETGLVIGRLLLSWGIGMLVGNYSFLILNIPSERE